MPPSTQTLGCCQPGFQEQVSGWETQLVGGAEKKGSGQGSEFSGLPISPPLPAIGSSATRSRGLPPRSRCTAGRPPRQSMPWTACAQRMPTPQGWATRSTFQDRCLRPGPALSGHLPPPPLVDARLDSVRLPGRSLCFSVLFAWEPMGLSIGKWREKLLSADCGVQAEPVSPSLVPLQTRDWNEELQTTRELPRKNLPERLLRERAIFKVPMSLRSTCTVSFSFLVSCGQEGTQCALLASASWQTLSPPTPLPASLRLVAHGQDGTCLRYGLSDQLLLVLCPPLTAVRFLPGTNALL